MNYRPLSEEEIQSLLFQGCSAENWAQVHVAEDFSPAHIHNTRFEGEVWLGVLIGRIRDRKNGFKKCGIYNSNIRNSEIGDSVCISYVKNLSNYSIRDHVIIENVGTLSADEDSSFGNGTLVYALNEGGGRELPVFDKLTSQLAYMAVMYRHDRVFTEKLLQMIRTYCESRKSGRGVVHTGTEISDSLIIRNVEAGSYSVISGACLLEDGTIGSCIEDPAYIGEGVIAKKFIILSGSRIDGGAIIDKCFIGQCVKIGKQFTAENSLFFANSEAYHGEACSLFAGPYTVTHHKSTLMIAGMFSFFNAGSGSNQSNHMYKLGPVHQGILERGCKTGSFAYLRLPVHIGAFTVVMGKHNANFDTREFPFSYISEEKGRSELTPAMNLFTIGIRRDIEKWSERDRRKDPVRLDLVHFDLFSPYIMSRISDAIKILRDLGEQTPSTRELVSYKGIQIHRLLFKTARKYYEIALKVYIGREIIKHLDGISSSPSRDEIRDKLKSGMKEGKGKWLDISGLFSPADQIDRLVNDVKEGKIGSVTALDEKLRDIDNHYDQYAWTWCSELITDLTGNPPENLSTTDLINMIGDWKVSSIKLINMILTDAEKEFDTSSRIGFGVDGDEQTRNMDFQAVRGSYDQNRYVADLRNELKETEEKATKLISILEKCT